MADSDFTLQEAADQLGVHYMTAYRYVRLGLLPAAKHGGTWRVTRVDLDEFRAGSVTAPQPDGGGRRRAPWAERLEARLIAGDARGAWGVIEAALTAGSELDEVYLDVLSPAMASIGAQWEAGQLDVAVEHRATGIAMRLVGRLGPRFVRRGRTRGAVVIGAPAGERHSLSTAMLADLIRGNGWEVSDLGADTPDASFVHAACDESDLIAVGVSVSTAGSLESARSALAALRAALPDVLLVLGGGAVRSEAQAKALGADAYAASGKDFTALLEATRGTADTTWGSAVGS
jgi:excisionase family DNA binding protein